MFNKSNLKTGMFGVMTNGYRFVIVNDSIIYQDGYDLLESMTDDMCLRHWNVEKVYDNCVSFRNLDANLRGVSKSATLVYDRTAEPKRYNGKVICIDNCGNNDNYTVGKIYQFENGHLTTDKGDKLPYSAEIYSFRDWSNFSLAKWMEVKE